MSKKDHLSEIPDYYDRLEKLEDEAKDEGVFIDVEALKKAGEFAERPKAITFVEPTTGFIKEDMAEYMKEHPLPHIPRNEDLIRKLKEAGA